MLKDILKKESIEIGVTAHDWMESIKKAGEILVRDGKVEEVYVDNMIKAVDEMGPYIVVMPGIAFAHSRPDESVKETCISMVRLHEPVEFGSEHNDPVKIVFAFGAVNGEEHLNALGDLAEFLQHEENQSLIMNEEDVEYIYMKMTENYK